jgi:hypothetical protein
MQAFRCDRCGLEAEKDEVVTLEAKDDAVALDRDLCPTCWPEVEAVIGPQWVEPPE